MIFRSRGEIKQKIIGRCAFVAGVLLVLLALALAVQLVQTGSARSDQQQRVVEVMAELESNCLTCHTTTAHVLFVERPTAAEWPTTTRRTLTLPDVSSRSPVETQTLELGRRILALPEVTGSSGALDEVVTDFLQVYDSLAANPDAPVRVSTWQQLDQIEQALRTLEHQAQPYKWRAVERIPEPPDSAALHNGPTSPASAALHEPALVRHAVIDYHTLNDECPVCVPLQAVLTVRRRGPPAGRAVLDSVFFGRWPSDDALSPFVFGDHDRDQAVRQTIQRLHLLPTVL